MGQGLDNKISNIIGAKIPQWVLKQLETRSRKNSQNSRDNDNILFIANKTAWIRLVSSVNIQAKEDLNYFKRIVGDENITDPTSLAKNFILFGGNSKYLNKNSYQLRSGIGSGGSYGMLGDKEIRDFGYKPMPGITSVTIDTQGRLGSVRAATINFKCWNKDQLDIIDALYFKLGFTMFLEWGHTFFYPNSDSTKNKTPDKIISTELYSIDPFQPGLAKEEINVKISQNSRDSEGNYDAMLGIVTNFNFSYNQEGGYDCTLKLLGLGYLGDSIKINNSGTLPSLLEEEILRLNKTLVEIEQARLAKEAASNQAAQTTVVDRKLKTIEQTLRDLSAAGEIKGTVLKITPSSPETIITTTATVQQGGKTTYTKNVVQQPTGEFAKPDTVVRTKDGERYIYVTRIGQVIKYDSNASYNGLIDIDQLDTYRSNLTLFQNDKIGKFLSNLVLEQNTSGTKVYAIGSVRNQDARQFRITYKTKVKDGETVGEIEKYITFEFTLVEYGVSAGRNLIKDDILPAIRKALNNQLKISIYEGQNNGLIVDFRGEYEVDGFRTEAKNNEVKAESVLSGGDIPSSTPGVNKVPITKKGSFKISTNDTSIIKDISTSEQNNLVEREEYLKKLNAQNKVQTPAATSGTPSETPKPDINAIATQIKQSLNYQSSLEIMLRTIQVHALNKAINKTGAPDLDIGKTTHVLDLWDAKDIVNYKDVNSKTSKSPFLNQIFSSGIFSTFINDLVNSENINDSEYTQVGAMDPETRFKINSKYGFATNLMANKAFISYLEPVNFKELLKAYVVPYQINQEIIKGTIANHPVYIPLGQLLMIINHACTIYDTKKDSQFQTPLIYIDFNPELNFCLTNSKHLSTDPWTCLIPFEGGFEDFKTLFDKNILSDDGTAIAPTSNSKEKIPLFNPKTQDFLSGKLPKLKFDEQPIEGKSTKEIGNVYRGKLMNILLNIDYLVQLVQQYSHKDGSNAVYLKTFIEQILTDINKSLGNFNAFRLSYNDSANTYQIIDDQILPTLSNEEQLMPRDNTTELPLLGKNSIAKSIEIKSEISSKLSNMLAISANSTIPNKATLSTNGDSFGFINTNFIDRYITDKLPPTGSNESKKTNDTLKTSAAQFNSTISDFYSKINPSQTTVAHATNYYIEKMATIKNDDYATRASFMIPVSVNLTMDGISGFNMGQAFSIPDKLLPYTYTVRKTEGFSPDRVNNIGFVTVGLTHKIENNQWDTSIRANMIFLKNKTEFEQSTVERVEGRSGQFGVNPSNVSENIHGSPKRASGGSTTPRNTDQTVSITSPTTSTYIFGKAQNLGNAVNSKAHGAREANQVGQWQSENAWDLMVPAFTPVYAIFDGTITNVNFYEDVPFIWGYRFTLSGPNQAFYTHLDRSIYPSGTKVKKGDLIAYIGQPPKPDYAWSPHLHIGLKSGNLSTYIKSDGQII